MPVQDLEDLVRALAVVFDQLCDPALHAGETVLVRRADLHLILERDQVQGLVVVRQRVGRAWQLQGYVRRNARQYVITAEYQSVGLIDQADVPRRVAGSSDHSQAKPLGWHQAAIGEPEVRIREVLQMDEAGAVHGHLGQPV
jgi:hypothetical protein